MFGPDHMCPRHRKIYLTLLLTSAALVICLASYLTGSRYYPIWRERMLRTAFEQKAGPASWWPASWRQEYERHIKLADALAHVEKNLTVLERQFQERDAAQQRFLANVPSANVPGGLGSARASRGSFELERIKLLANEHRNDIKVMCAELEEWR